MNTKATLNPQEIINSYGAFIEHNPPLPLCIQDVSVLPFSKELILSSLLGAIQQGQAQSNEVLHVGAILLAQFQPGVGNTPLHSGGFNLMEFLQRRPPTKSPETVKEEMNEMQAEIEKGKFLAAKYEIFRKLVDEDLQQIEAKFSALKAIKAE